MIKGLIKGNFHGNIVRRVDLELRALLLVPGLPPHLPTHDPEPHQQDLGYTSRPSGVALSWGGSSRGSVYGEFVVERVCLGWFCLGKVSLGWVCRQEVLLVWVGFFLGMFVYCGIVRGGVLGWVYLGRICRGKGLSDRILREEDFSGAD